MDGLRLAFSWLTVLPLPAPEVRAQACRRAIGFAPLVGITLGAGAALLLWVTTTTGVSSLLAGMITVAALAAVSRGMHIDGLADTVDALGCYGSRERALEVMRDGSAGPFAVAALILVIGIQTVTFAELATGGAWSAVVLACAVGRAAFVLLCHQKMPAARDEGMGVLVAGSQPRWIVAAWWLTSLAVSPFVVPASWWAGPAAVLCSFALIIVFGEHIKRRFGGITGDTLGAGAELATTTFLVVCCFG